MKASKRIEEIVQEIISQEWISYAGNSTSRERWQMFCEENTAKKASLVAQAIVQYLDESGETSPSQEEGKHE